MSNDCSDRKGIDRRDVLLSGSSLLAASALIGGGLVSTTGKSNAQMRAGTPTPLPSDQIGEVATSAYIYAYPLILMEVTRRVSTNVADASHFGKVPMNQFGNLPAFPDATFTDVVRPNADTLYSFMWFDVSKEPLLISVPDSGGRYYLLPMLDMWTDVFESTGKRTTGTNAQLLAIAGPGWQGGLPAEATLIQSPTAIGWIIGRTQTNGKADYDAVHKFQAGLVAMPLSQWGKSYQPPPGTINPDWDMKTPPTDQVEKLSPAAYFSLFTELTKLNPPHANDYPILHQMRRMGIELGKAFAFDNASPEIQRALTEAGPAALKKIKARFLNAGVATKDGAPTSLQSGHMARIISLGRGSLMPVSAQTPSKMPSIRRRSLMPMVSRSAATTVMYCILTRTRFRRYTAFGRSRCTTKSKPSRLTRLTAMPLGIAISLHSIPTARSTFTSSVLRPAKTENRTGCRPPQAAHSR